MTQFNIVGLEPSSYGFATLVLHSVPYTHTLRIRLGAIDAQPLAAELAGVQTVRSRVIASIRMFVERLDGRLSAVRLHRGTGNMVEAEVVIETGLDDVTVPVTCGDGFALAIVHKLPVFGDNTLASLLQPVTSESNEQVALPSGIESFLSSL